MALALQLWVRISYKMIGSHSISYIEVDVMTDKEILLDDY